MTRYKILVIDNADETKTPIRHAAFTGTEDELDAVWEEVENALHLIRAFGKKQRTQEELLKGFNTKGKLRDLE